VVIETTNYLLPLSLRLRGATAEYGAMEPQMVFCQRIAAECEQRARESTDDEVREFLFRMRDNWLRVARGLQDVYGVAESGGHKATMSSSPGD
jgi:hypothetical protein